MEAAKASGIVGMSVSKLDKAPLTQALMEGMPYEYDPALAVYRKRNDILQSVKKQHFPNGTDLPGVMARYEGDLKKVAYERYVHAVHADNGANIIVTFVPALAKFIHSARASLHDFTYKRVRGKWQEWECVLYIDSLNKRITYARVYANSENRHTYKMMWSLLWDLIERVTGKPVLFKFIHGTGLRAIIVDACKAQLLGCGDDLIQRNEKELSSKVKEKDPNEILRYVVRTCVVHFQRGINDLAKSIHDVETIGYLRNALTLQSEDEWKQFTDWCENSPHKAIRDWFAEKKPYCWWIGSLNQHFTRITEEDWYSTPADTNMNESAHPLANQNGGIQLPLLEAIEAAEQLDLRQLAQIKAAEQNFVASNPLKSVKSVQLANIRRDHGRICKAGARNEAVNELDELTARIAAETEKKNAAAKAAKELRERKKELQQATGVKQKRNPARGILPRLLEDAASAVSEDASHLPIALQHREANEESVALSMSQTCNTRPVSEAQTSRISYRPSYVQPGTSNTYPHNSDTAVNTGAVSSYVPAASDVGQDPNLYQHYGIPPYPAQAQPLSYNYSADPRIIPQYNEFRVGSSRGDGLPQVPSAYYPQNYQAYFNSYQ